MRTLAIDGTMGASGDMLLGALLAAGAQRNALAPVEHALPVEYVTEIVRDGGVEATDVTVEHGDAGHGHHHRPSGSTDHAHGGHETQTAEGHGPGRTLEEIREAVADIDLPAAVREDVLGTFELLARAEAAVHGTDPATTTVHEVGTDDAIADVAGTALLLWDLDVDRVVVAPLAAGGGEVSMAHGTYPVPPPAVTEIAARSDLTIEGGPVDAELLTPTGAALLAHLGESVDALPSLAVDAVGYGAGSKTFESRPNVLRVQIAESVASAGSGALSLASERIAVLETTVDDVPPEVLGSLQTRLGPGALDVSVRPTTMKKSRPGHEVQVIADPAAADDVSGRLAAATGTLGVRVQRAARRLVADRTIETVDVDVDGTDYAVDVKIATDAEGVRYDVSAEYDDALSVAEETDRPVREIAERAERRVRDT
ncbi:MAG: nickel pincer cofactor biosynthesis protein LarC [Halanaeroarchaeum sp.]